MVWDIFLALCLFFIGLPLAIIALCGIFSGVVYLIAAVSETNQRWLREEQSWLRRDAVRAFVISAVLVVSCLGIVTLCLGFSWIR